MGHITTVSRKFDADNPLFRPVNPGTSPNESVAVTEAGSQTSNQSGSPSTYNNAYGLLGGDLTNIEGGYIVIGYMAGTGTSSACGYYLHEGENEYDFGHSHSGSLDTVRQALMGRYPNPDAVIGTMGHTMFFSPASTSGNHATWGLYMGRQQHTCQHGCMIALPITGDSIGQGNAATAEDHGGGGILGQMGVDIITSTPGNNLNPQSMADVDNTVSGTFTVPASRRSERWLLACMAFAQKSGNGFDPLLRWYNHLDGEDIFNVRTNNTTGGSNFTGRGFQSQSSNGSPTQQPQLSYRVLESLRTGEHEYGTTTNSDDDVGNTYTLIGNRLVLIRLNSFNKFEYIENTTAVTVNSDSWSNSSFEVTIEADGFTAIWLGFSTTVHQNTGQVRFRIQRDGSTVLTSEGSDYPTLGPNEGSRTGGSNGTGDTDNDTAPYTINWVDTPAAGSRTYRVQYRRNSGASGANNAMFNTRDDGTDGYRGTFFAAELRFPTRQPG